MLPPLGTTVPAETRVGAITRARAIEPSIPQVGDDGTPITDELEYVLRLR